MSNLSYYLIAIAIANLFALIPYVMAEVMLSRKKISSNTYFNLLKIALGIFVISGAASFIILIN